METQNSMETYRGTETQGGSSGSGTIFRGSMTKPGAPVPNPAGPHKSEDFYGTHRSNQTGELMDAVEAHNTKYFVAGVDGPRTEGFLARWENLPAKKPSSKLILQNLPAATPEFTRFDYLKPQNYNESNLNTLNYHPSCDNRQTRFHRGFQRRHQTDIRQDAARLQKEQHIQNARDTRDATVIDNFKQYSKDYQFNIFSGEGRGRDGEFKSIGKRVVNPCHNYEVYAEHDTDQRNRMRQSLHRFSETPVVRPSANREAQLASEGFLESKKETMIIGYGEGAPRVKLRSQGVSDNFSHLRDGSQCTQWQAVKDKNKSQIIFG